MNFNPAFELLRQHKDVKEETEKLVMKKVRGRITQNELITVFENGLSGQYGKLYSADPQTLLSWVEQFEKSKNSAANYLESPLLPVSTNQREPIAWDKEANKCYKAFLNGVSEEYFHPAVYDRMMLDDKIKMNSYLKKLLGEGMPENIRVAKQKILKDVFAEYKSRGLTTIYFIR